MTDSTPNHTLEPEPWSNSVIHAVAELGGPKKMDVHLTRIHQAVAFRRSRWGQAGLNSTFFATIRRTLQQTDGVVPGRQDGFWRLK